MSFFFFQCNTVVFKCPPHNIAAFKIMLIPFEIIANGTNAPPWIEYITHQTHSKRVRSPPVLARQTSYSIFFTLITDLLPISSCFNYSHTFCVLCNIHNSLSLDQLAVSASAWQEYIESLSLKRRATFRCKLKDTLMILPVCQFLGPK